MLNPVSYIWKQSTIGTHYGLIAQEIKDVLDICGKSEHEFKGYDGEHEKKGLSYCEFISPIIKSIQDISNIKTVKIRNPVTSYTATTDDHMLMFDIDVDTTITLSDNAGYKGRELVIILADRTASQTLTIQRAGTDTIDDRVSTSTILNTLDARIKLVSGGNGVWYIM
jgi:hypothetical protein